MNLWVEVIAALQDGNYYLGDGKLAHDYIYVNHRSLVVGERI